MTMKRRGRSQPGTPQAAASANLGDEGVFVSGRGHRYRSLKSNGTIVFDREVAPGIFMPSTPESDGLSEEYRRVMTLGKSVALRPDDLETVEQDMRSIAPPNKGKVFYDVVRAPTEQIARVALPAGVRMALTRALGTLPSDTFIREVETALGYYLWDREQVSNATPKKVQARITNVRKQIDALCDAIDELQGSDSYLIRLAMIRESIKNRRTISGKEMRLLLMLYSRHVTEAEMRVARAIPKGGAKGRKRGYAEDVFASRVVTLVQNETGTRPTTTRARKKEGGSTSGSILTQVLTILMESARTRLLQSGRTDSTMPRNDVEALARRALKSFSSGDG